MSSADRTCPACGSRLVEVDNPFRREVRHPRGVECDGVVVEMTPDQIDFFDRYVVLAKDLPPFTFERLVDGGYFQPSQQPDANDGAP